MISWTHSLELIDWEKMEELYRLAPLGNKSAESLKTVFTNSRFRWFVFDGDKLIGAGRALADGADCSYLCDIALLPEYQGQGLGREIVLRLLQDSRGHKKILLYSVPGKEAFYKKLGFHRLLTAMAQFENHEEAVQRGHLDPT
ncbi:MAG: GNAT family N-acetyltransferase [Pirellulales bacterium]